MEKDGKRMLGGRYRAMLSQKSVIRELSEYAEMRSHIIGADNVFDFSLGNPSSPTPANFQHTVVDLYETSNPTVLHGYSPSLGNVAFKEAVADSLDRRFGMEYNADHIFPTAGAAGALAHALRAVVNPGDQVLTFAPYFPEYREYVAGAGAELKVVDASLATFEIDFELLEAALTPQVRAVLINTPNNPTGVVYSHRSLERLAAVLAAKQSEYSHEIFLISDEPYREITFDGEIQHPSAYYDNTLTCYSWSKSLSLPGERIGYVAVNPQARDASILVPIMAQISRQIGHNCPSITMQMAVAANVDETSSLIDYESNMNILYDALSAMRFNVVKPQGSFYIFPQALEEDASVFCKKATAYDLILVPSESFGVPGHFRMAYCMSPEKLRRSIPVLDKFVREVYGH